MPTNDSTATRRRFTASGGSVFEGGVLYAVIPGGPPAEAAHARAQWVAGALNAARENERETRLIGRPNYHLMTIRRALQAGISLAMDRPDSARTEGDIREGLRSLDAVCDETIERPWEGEGPSVEEAGGESILARIPDGDFVRFVWNHTISEWTSAAFIGTPTGWRPMPKADPRV